MECKVIRWFWVITSRHSINRNIVECKVKEAVNNVVSDGVLIETSWNVKWDLFRLCPEAIGINRNIVECKDVWRFTLSSGTTVLIETSWNVKQVVDELAESILRINRNIVECKVPIRQRQNQMMCSINRNIVECKDA